MVAPVTLADARKLGIRHVRGSRWPPGMFLELIRPDEVPGARPPLATAWPTAVISFKGWNPVDRLYWRLPWEDYVPLDLHGED
jgi:hypothetical protein